MAWQWVMIWLYRMTSHPLPKGDRGGNNAQQLCTNVKSSTNVKTICTSLQKRKEKCISCLSIPRSVNEDVCREVCSPVRLLCAYDHNDMLIILDNDDVGALHECVCQWSCMQNPKSCVIKHFSSSKNWHETLMNTPPTTIIERQVSFVTTHNPRRWQDSKTSNWEESSVRSVKLKLNDWLPLSPATWLIISNDD